MNEMMQTVGDTDWFVRDRFGLFIHWGIYAMPARHEWVKSREQISDEEYEIYFKHFEPDLYDPGLWAKAASKAGMKYFVVTTKHHDGFCLWDSKLTDYKSTKTPIAKDLLKPMVKAFREEDMRVGFYHSLLDWHHPEYFVDDRHPQRDDDRSQLNHNRDQMKYADYLHGQVRELLTDFGDVDILWFDFSSPDPEDRLNWSKGKGWEAWRSKELYRLVRELQPNIVLNDRLDLADHSTWDVKTPEQFQPRGPYTVNGTPVVWEACQTLSGSWGYYRDEHSFRSVRQLLSTLIDCVAKDGNLLLNVGPTGRGEFDYRAIQRLEGIGKWMHHHSRSIYGCGQLPPEFTVPEHCKVTYNKEKNRAYIHIFDWPYKHLHLDGKAWLDRLEYAQLLHDGSEVKRQGLEQWQAHAALNAGLDSDKTLTLLLPQSEPKVEIPVIEVFLK